MIDSARTAGDVLSGKPNADSATRPARREPVLSVRGVSIAAGGCTLLEGVDFELRAAEIVAIVGPNGAGKSTLLRAMAGLGPVAGGAVAIDGSDIARSDHTARARSIALVASDADVPHGMSVREVVLVGRFAHRAWWDWSRRDDDGERADAALQRVGLTPFAARPFTTLSAGERQRAWIALALAQDAPFLLLDEPTSHLDVKHSLAVLDLVQRLAREDRRAVAVVLHDLSEAAAIADRIVVLGERRMLACDAPQRAFAEGILERAFGVAFDRTTAGGGFRVLPRYPQHLRGTDAS